MTFPTLRNGKLLNLKYGMELAIAISSADGVMEYAITENNLVYMLCSVSFLGLSVHNSQDMLGTDIPP